LNCVIANGGESGTSTIIRSTTSTSTSSSTSTQRSIAQAVGNPNGPIDLNQANGWLKNVTDYCTARGVSLTGGGTVTAIPTTTLVLFSTLLPSFTLPFPSYLSLFVVWII
jgi:hypothetical protein